MVSTCVCGAWECGGLLARITVAPDLVTWSHFQTPHGISSLKLGRSGANEAHISTEGFGPLEFDRAQYETALANPERIAWPYPAPVEEPPAPRA